MFIHLEIGTEKGREREQAMKDLILPLEAWLENRGRNRMRKRDMKCDFKD